MASGAGPDRDSLGARVSRRPWRACVVGALFCCGLLAGGAGAHAGPFSSGSGRGDAVLGPGGVPQVVEAESARVARADALRADALRADALRAAARRAAAGPATPTAGAGGAGAADAAASGLVEELAGPAGRAAVHGPAVTVELNDAPPASRRGPFPPGVRAPAPDDLVVHQQDVQAVVNALWAGGAEAMTIMDRRVTAQTAVRCVGNTLLLHGEVFSPPFRITAIGGIAALRTRLGDDPQVRIYQQYVAAYGLGYRVTEVADARLPAYDGPLTLPSAVGR
ncbi:DUF881 domain-containing protein [Frankia sp. AgB32]|uniref:DUF881 domain-containing protein n=1 Tax=Frankia sp. AgB32 TaxID=631119 RepID=UPI00200DEEF3|nr:DUF881 domain-containing protein [Frankia sp. AgB32]MCK9893200.1 DUF881 domain-containing protein [Frankia sp. AgB32]